MSGNAEATDGERRETTMGSAWDGFGLKSRVIDNANMRWPGTAFSCPMSLRGFVSVHCTVYLNYRSSYPGPTESSPEIGVVMSYRTERLESAYHRPIRTAIIQIQYCSRGRDGTVFTCGNYCGPLS